MLFIILTKLIPNYRLDKLTFLLVRMTDVKDKKKIKTFF